jgi:N-acetylglucosamine kinase-like BadF-type ATPase
MTLLAGVDAGASHTALLLAEADGSALARRSGGPGAIRPDTVTATAGVISDLVRAALGDANRSGPLDALVVGAAGAGQDTNRAGLEQALVASGIARRVQVTTDGHIALQSAFGDEPGIVLAAGTGSIGLARAPDGTVRRAGGHGWRLGDEGSGYAVAHAALSAAARAADGRGPATVLLEALPSGARQPDLATTLQWARAADVPAIAGLSMIVMDAAGRGDSVARAIVVAAAKDLAAHVHALLKYFPEGRGAPVALTGGLLAEGSFMRRALLQALEPDSGRIVVTAVEVDPAAGAVALARKLR